MFSIWLWVKGPLSLVLSILFLKKASQLYEPLANVFSVSSKSPRITPQNWDFFQVLSCAWGVHYSCSHFTVSHEVSINLGSASLLTPCWADPCPCLECRHIDASSPLAPNRRPPVLTQHSSGRRGGQRPSTRLHRFKGWWPKCVRGVKKALYCDREVPLSTAALYLWPQWAFWGRWRPLAAPPDTPAQSKHDSSLKYTDTQLKGGRLTRTQKRTVCHPGADWCQRLGVVNPGLSRGSCIAAACSSDGGFGRRITLHYLRRPNHRVILNEKFALDSWTVSDPMHWGQIGSALLCLQGGAFPRAPR